jgi:hypothetical protein
VEDKATALSAATNEGPVTSPKGPVDALPEPPLAAAGSVTVMGSSTGPLIGSKASALGRILFQEL